MKKQILSVLALMFMFVSCNQGKVEQTEVSSEFQYEILNVDSMKYHFVDSIFGKDVQVDVLGKATYEVLISEKYDESKLTKIAEEIIGSNPEESSVFIQYFIADRNDNLFFYGQSKKISGDIQTTISDTSIDISEGELPMPNAEIIGTWDAGAGIAYCIFKCGSNYYMTDYYQGHYGTPSVVTQHKKDGMVTFFDPENTQEWFSIDVDGNLRAYDSEGFITWKKLE